MSGKHSLGSEGEGCLAARPEAMVIDAPRPGRGCCLPSRKHHLRTRPVPILPNFTIEQCGRSIEGPALDADGTKPITSPGGTNEIDGICRT
jgi:hypothetical protein